MISSCAESFHGLKGQLFVLKRFVMNKRGKSDWSDWEVCPGRLVMRRKKGSHQSALSCNMTCKRLFIIGAMQVIPRHIHQCITSWTKVLGEDNIHRISSFPRLPATVGR